MTSFSLCRIVKHFLVQKLARSKILHYLWIGLHRNFFQITYDESSALYLVVDSSNKNLKLHFSLMVFGINDPISNWYVPIRWRVGLSFISSVSISGNLWLRHLLGEVESYNRQRFCILISIISSPRVTQYFLILNSFWVAWVRTRISLVSFLLNSTFICLNCQNALPLLGLYSDHLSFTPLSNLSLYTLHLINLTWLILKHLCSYLFVLPYSRKLPLV